MNAEERDLFDAAHARLEDYVGHPTVQSLVSRFIDGALGVVDLLEGLMQIPEVQTIISGLGSAALASVPGVGVFAAPLWPFVVKAIAFAAAKPKKAPPV